jgi:hypothetical protein
MLLLKKRRLGKTGKMEECNIGKWKSQNKTANTLNPVFQYSIIFRNSCMANKI